MTVYKNKKSHSLKWLIAFIIFALAMTITWSDVYGADVSGKTPTAIEKHRAGVLAKSKGNSRFHPHWFPGFPKPTRTILADARPILASSTDVGTVDNDTSRPISSSILGTHRKDAVIIS